MKTYIGFAALDSKKVGYFTDRERGLYQLSEKGRLTIQRLISQNQTESNKIKESISKEISKEVQEYQKEDKKNKESSEISDVDIAGENEKEYLNDLKIIQEMNPFAFERLCMRLFKKVGYEDVETTPKSRDGGYDGFGYLVFGLVRFKVAFQAKRFSGTNKVGLDDITKFIGGPMDPRTGVKAEKGVFITTSDFTRDAEEKARQKGIELINGEKLIDLLKENEIGYTKEMKFSIDKKFFEEL